MKRFTFMGLDKIKLHLHPQLIKLARAGSVPAAAYLMSDAGILIQSGLAMPEPLASYIGEALMRSAVLDSRFKGDANAPFNLKRSKGRSHHGA